MRCWFSCRRLRLSTQNGSLVNSGFSHALKMHIGRDKKLASAQAACGPPRAGAVAALLAGKRAGTVPGAVSLRWLVLGAVLSADVLALPVPAADGLELAAALGSLAACTTRLAAAEAAVWAAEAADNGALATTVAAEAAAVAAA